MNKRWIVLFVAAIVGLAAIDIVLSVRLSQSRADSTRWIAEVRELGSQAHVYETYIVKNFRYAGISAETICAILSETDRTIYGKDSVLVVLLPQGACEACANALFQRLDAENCPKKDLHLISERPQSVLEREWRAHGFGAAETGVQNIFQRFGLHSEILLLKINPYDRTAKPMICEPPYMKFIPAFLRS